MASAVRSKTPSGRLKVVVATPRWRGLWNLLVAISVGVFGVQLGGVPGAALAIFAAASAYVGFSMLLCFVIVEFAADTVRVTRRPLPLRPALMLKRSDVLGFAEGQSPWQREWVRRLWYRQWGDPTWTVYVMHASAKSIALDIELDAAERAVALADQLTNVFARDLLAVSRSPGEVESRR